MTLKQLKKLYGRKDKKKKTDRFERLSSCICTIADDKEIIRLKAECKDKLRTSDIKGRVLSMIAIEISLISILVSIAKDTSKLINALVILVFSVFALVIWVILDLRNNLYAYILEILENEEILRKNNRHLEI